MALTKEQKEAVIKEFGQNEKDTGRTEVQIAHHTKRIEAHTEHFKVNKKDQN
jgi:small subunit ribosomal protein S15